MELRLSIFRKRARGKAMVTADVTRTMARKYAVWKIETDIVRRELIFV